MTKPHFSRVGVRAVADFLSFVAVFMFVLSSRGWAQDYDYPDSATAAQEPAYPGIPPKGKVEATMGTQQVRFYGTILMNASASDSVEVGQDLVLWPLPGGSTTLPDGTTVRNANLHDLIFSARQSVFGLQIRPTTPAKDKWVASGNLEFDFFGGRPFDAQQPQGRVFNEPRLRLAYLQFQKGKWRIVAGQDHMIISPLDPVSLSHVAAPLGATAGDLWGWQPQVRVEMTNQVGKASTLLQFGVIRPQFADSRLETLPATGSALDSTSSGLGERTTKPFIQTRYSATIPMMGSKATFGIGGHYGRERIGDTRELESWAVAYDFSVPLQSRIRLRGEGFLGANLIPFQGGVLQGAALFNPGGGAPILINKIGSSGGWGELIIRATSDNKNVFYAGAGTDDPRDRNLLAGSARAKNTVSWASFFRKLSDNVTLAFEWSNWQFRTKTFTTGLPTGNGAAGRGNVFDLSLAYQF